MSPCAVSIRWSNACGASSMTIPRSPPSSPRSGAADTKRLTVDDRRIDDLRNAVGEMNSSSRQSVNPSMPWFRSFYWRVALGLFAFLALTLAAEVAIFLWMSDRISGSLPARQPARAVRIIASDVGAALAANPRLDLEDYIDDQYENVLQTFVVVMDDGRIVSNDDSIPAGELDRLLQDMRRRPPPGSRQEPSIRPDGERRQPLPG